MNGHLSGGEEVNPAAAGKIGSPERGAGIRRLIPREGTHHAAVGVCYLTEAG